MALILATAIGIFPTVIWIFSAPILSLFGQEESVSRNSAKFLIILLPSMFGFAYRQCMQIWCQVRRRRRCVLPFHMTSPMFPSLLISVCQISLIVCAEDECRNILVSSRCVTDTSRTYAHISLWNSVPRHCSTLHIQRVRCLSPRITHHLGSRLQIWLSRRRVGTEHHHSDSIHPRHGLCCDLRRLQENVAGL